jgi:alkylated DNA nucleotide flippase Atl1
MTAVWQNAGEGWRLLPPAGFPDEAALHGLVEEAPELLPLSGSPRLTVLGSEVQLGANYADLIAIEPTGRLAIIEVKLARNAEARRAVVAQALTYAAYLKGLTVDGLELDVLATHLRIRGHESLAAAAAEEDQERTLDIESFREELAATLAEGAFRLVFVLDDAPPELVRLVGFLESIGDKLVIDLVTVSAYDVNGSRILVPQRVDPEREPVEPIPRPARARVVGEYSDGPGDFLAGIERAPAAQQPTLKRLAGWASDLEKSGLARLRTYNGPGRQTLLPLVAGEDVGLVTLWNDGGAYISLWRTVFERRAPKSIDRIEALIAPTLIGQGNTVRDISDDFLRALSDAYAEAVGNPRIVESRAFDWSLARKAVELLPAGAWTTYGDIAGLAGTAAIAVGRWVSTNAELPNAWRVLGSNGKPRPDFHWDDPDDTRDVTAVLAAEGVRFDNTGSADDFQRLRVDDLRRLIEEADESGA